MNTFTPPITPGSIVTPSFSRAARRCSAPAPASLVINSFHSAAVFGSAFQLGVRKGAAIAACNWGLTVPGTGMTRPGTVRGPALLLAAFSCASRAANPASGGAATCAEAAEARTVAAKSETIIERRRSPIM